MICSVQSRTLAFCRMKLYTRFNSMRGLVLICHITEICWHLRGNTEMGFVLFRYTSRQFHFITLASTHFNLDDHIGSHSIVWHGWCLKLNCIDDKPTLYTHALYTWNALWFQSICAHVQNKNARWLDRWLYGTCISIRLDFLVLVFDIGV